MIEKESRDANIVCHWANADHEGAAAAIVKGLSARDTKPVGARPGYLIHTSGTGVLLFGDMDKDVYGGSSDHVYNDWDNLSEVTGLPDHAFHRVVDKIVLQADPSTEKVRTAIVCPPTIYGPGRGPGNIRSHQVPELSRCTIEQGHGIMVGAGKTHWTEVHVQDLSDLYLKLVEAAVVEFEGNKSNATWGSEGYYFAENGDFQWGDVARWVAEAAEKQGLIESAEVRSVDKDAANKLTVVGAALWGANSRVKAIRARKLLGWQPTKPSLKDTVPETVAFEAKKLGRAKGHATKAAGDA